ncbi:AAA family ATPase [Natronomonas sp.]|uniref:AAA family ATPase n=1 Tax=Natronomonas sp. TaxID=2184060 RepID=UPI0026386A82|nr:AAA family ATPase [Natronomonas sp.]
MRVIGTVGLAGSGKGEFAAVAETTDVPVVTMGDVIRAECRDRGLDPAEHHGEVAASLREERGPTAIAEASLPHIEAALERSETVVVDGIRSGTEVDVFEDRFGAAFVLVGIEAPFELRKERLDERGRDDVESGEALAARDERELGFGLRDALQRADVTIENTGSLDRFRRRVRGVLE